MNKWESERYNRESEARRELEKAHEKEKVTNHGFLGTGGIDGNYLIGPGPGRPCIEIDTETEREILQKELERIMAELNDNKSEDTVSDWQKGYDEGYRAGMEAAAQKTAYVLLQAYTRLARELELSDG